MSIKPIKSILISVFHKTGLENILPHLQKGGIKVYSTGGTQKFLEENGVGVTPVESLTGYPSVFDGRVKTLHPAVFGGILQIQNNADHQAQATQHNIATIDAVVVDLYPFEQTVSAGGTPEQIIEKIDIGGIALIRAAAKNYNDVVIIPAQAQYADLANLLAKGGSTLEERKQLAMQAFATSSHYDAAIFNYFGQGQLQAPLRVSYNQATVLRYGENPHQQAAFYGPLNNMFDQLHGKALSYNNLVDIDAAVGLIAEFEPEKAKGQTTFAILKHTNACGVATAHSTAQAYELALAADPVSAFGGVLVCNNTIDMAAAQKINDLFCEVLIAPKFDPDALELLQCKKNRILLVQKTPKPSSKNIKTLLNGVIVQDKDLTMEGADDFTVVTKRQPTPAETEALAFANKLVKHTKSNAIVLSNNHQLLASGVGQTSRVDALNQAILKAKHFGFDLKGAVMASDAFFPFPDCVEIAQKEGITAVVQPGGSRRDNESVAYCDAHNMAMVTTGVRHFLH